MRAVSATDAKSRDNSQRMIELDFVAHLRFLTRCIRRESVSKTADDLARILFAPGISFVCLDDGFIMKFH